MLMYSNNQSYYPQSQSLPYNTNPLHNNNRQDYSESRQQINERLKTFHVEIRNKQLKAYKNRIREEFLRTSKIDELLDNMPNDNESSRFWALQLARQYSCSQKYTINLHQALDIFKIAQRFPNRQTLELLQVVIIRVQGDIVDEMFQYDVMRLLHGFINFSGKSESFIVTQSPIEEVQMLKDNVVITEATEQIERAQNLSVTYLDRLEMARLTITIISQLCRKQPHTRNFAILNHKTFNYCSKLYKIFGDKIKIEYYMLLEAATKYPFERYGDRQFKRMIDTIINTFFDEKIDIKIEILSQNNKRSYLKAYEYIIGAIKNLLGMQNPEIMIRILKPNPMGQIWIIPLMKSVIEQCNYVLSYPSVQQNLEQFMPLNIMSAIVDMLIVVKDQFDKYPMNQLSCSLTPILRELLCVIQNKNISMNLKSGILTRRGTYFLLSNHLYEIENYSIEQLLSLIYFNPNKKENLIDMLSFYLRNEVQYLSVAQICNLIKSIFVNVPVSLYEALLIPSQLFQTMVEKVLQTYYSVGSKMLSNEDSCNNMILYTVDQFFESVGPEIGERVNLYIKILQANSERLYMKFQSEQIRSDIREMLYKLLSMCNQRGHIQQV